MASHCVGSCRPAPSAWRSGFHAALMAGLLWGSAGCGLFEPGPPADESLAVLFLGNSLTYTNDLPGMVEALLDSAGVEPVVIRAIAEPNAGLEDHWSWYDGPNLIRRGGWDVVVLQQGPSATEGRPSLRHYAALFAALADSVGARTALYMVWPAESRFFDFDGVSDSYATAARDVNGLLFPAGEAWRAAWARDSSLALYGPDGFHPSLRGTYLAALVIVEQLAARSPVGLPRAFRWPGGALELTAEEALLLQQAAAEANAEFALP